MTSYTAEYIENRLEILFPKYKIEQVGMHLTEVALTNIDSHIRLSLELNMQRNMLN